MERKEIFETRFHEHYSRLCHLAYSYVADRDECEDIVQEVFIAIWKMEKDQLPDKEFGAYLTTAVRNSCISFLRKQLHSTISLEELPQQPKELTDTLHSDEEQEEISASEMLQEALATLPPKCREVFLMAKQEGMRYRDIAQTLNISEKTVENQMTKAMKMLRSYLNGKRLLWLVITFIVSILANHGWK